MNEATQKRLPYVRLDAGFHLARIIDMTPAEIGGYFRRLLIAINTGRRGIMPEADEMLDEAKAYYDQKREAGRRGGLTTQGKPSSGASSDASSHTNRHTGIQSDIQKMRESQDRAADAAALSQFDIPSLETFKTFGIERGFQPDRVEKCFRHYETSGWKDSGGQPVRNWKAKLSSWMNRPELAQPGEAATPISPEESRRKEDDERRKRTIREGAERIVAMQSWIDSGDKCPYGDPQADIETARNTIQKRYGPSALVELEKDIAKVTDEKRLEAERRKARE